LVGYNTNLCVEKLKNFNEFKAVQGTHGSARNTHNSKSKAFLKRIGYKQNLVLCYALRNDIVTAGKICEFIEEELTRKGTPFKRVFNSKDQCIKRFSDAIQSLVRKGVLVTAESGYGYTLSVIYHDLLDDSIGCNFDEILKKLIEERRGRTRSIDSSSEALKEPGWLARCRAEGVCNEVTIDKLYDAIFNGELALIRVHTNAKNDIQLIKLVFLRNP
jgi:hypothetical protein